MVFCPIRVVGAIWPPVIPYTALLTKITVMRSPRLAAWISSAVPMAARSPSPRGTVAATTGAALDTRVPAAGAPSGADAAVNHLEPVVAPMVGTFYRSSAPDARPLVSEGDFVDEGQVVCVIEAMKLFNEIQTDKRGRVARVLVENASPVEFGQPLFLLDPTAARG